MPMKQLKDKDREREQKGNRFALIIGNGVFGEPKLGMLPSVQYEVDTVTEVLSKEAIGGFQTIKVVDQSMRTIRAEIARLCNRAKNDDLLLIYYSGFGMITGDGELYFVAK